MITDFKVGVDKVVLYKSAFMALGPIYSPSGPLNKDYFAYNKPSDANDYVIVKGDKLYYDHDGSGANFSMVHLATFTNGAKLSHADIDVM